jgi:hypothetical protein
MRFHYFNSRRRLYMIYKKLEGTTSTSFQIAKNGVEFTYDKDGTGGLKIYTPKTEALFELGASDLDAAARPNDIPTAQAIVTYINNEVLDLDLTTVQESLNSLGEVIAAIGNDPNFFGNLTNIIGDDYLTESGALSSTLPQTRDTNTNNLVSGTISRRLTLGEQNRIDKKFRNSDGTSYNRLELTTDATIPGTQIQTRSLKPSINRTYRNNKTTYVYDTTAGTSNQMSLEDIRAMRPGVYTSNDGMVDVTEVNEKDYIFVHIDHSDDPEISGN